MKNVFKLSALLLLVTVFSVSSFAQKGKPFKGIITYSISYEGEDLDPTQKAQMPSEMKLYIKDGLMKQESISGMGKQSAISDFATKTQTILIDMMGQKLAIKTTAEETEKALSEAPKVTFEAATETKDVAGYKCKKMEITDDKENTVSFYYTEDLGVDNPNWATPYSEIKGLLMEYSAVQADLTITYKATLVETGKVKNSDFIIPPGFKELTSEEAKAMFSGE